MQDKLKQGCRGGSGWFPKLRKGVAKDRRISIEDKDMRHGRKSSSKNLTVTNVTFLRT